MKPLTKLQTLLLRAKHVWLWAKHGVIRKLKKVRVPYTDGANLFDFLRVYIEDIADPKFTLNASAMAFNFFLALIPTLIFIFSLIPFIPVDNLSERVYDFMRENLPQDTTILVRSTLNELLKDKSLSLISISFVTIFIGVTRGLVTMSNAFDSLRPEVKERNAIKKYAVAFVLFLVLFVLGVIEVSVTIAVSFVVKGLNYFDLQQIEQTLHFDALQIGGLEKALLRGATFLLDLCLVLIVISLIYSVLPTRKLNWKIISPGSVVSTVLLVVALQLVKLFFAQFANYNKVYGGLATVIVLMIWFQLISFVLLIGFHLNVSMKKMKNRKEDPE